MANKKIKMLIAISIVAILVASASIWYINGKNSLIAPTPSTPKCIASLTLSNAPKLNETANLTFKIERNPEWDDIVSFKNESFNFVQIVLPEGFISLSGDTKWRGNFSVSSDATLEFNVKVKAIKTGNWTIIGVAGHLYNTTNENFTLITSTSKNGNAWVINREGNLTPMRGAPPAYLWIIVGENYSEIRDKMFPIEDTTPDWIKVIEPCCFIF